MASLFDIITGKQQPQLPLIQVQESANGGLELAPQQNGVNPNVLAQRLIGNVKNAGNKVSTALFGQQPVQNSSLYNTLTNNNDTPIKEYQDYLSQNGYEDNVVNGVPQGLNHGYKEIDDWIKQYNTGAGASNPINIPQTEEEIGLARQGLFNQLLPAQVQENQVASTVPVGQRIGGAIPDLFNGFKENFQNGFSMNNWGNNDLGNNRSKGLMYRAGEGLGTVARMANSPLGRGLAVAGLAALSGEGGINSLGYGLQTAVANQQNVLNDRLYRQSLINNYGYTPEQLNTVGYVGKDTFKNLADSSYKNQLNSYRNRRLDQTSYIKMVNELDKLHKAGQIPDDVYLASIRDLNEQYTTSNTYNIADIGASNDTRKTNSQIELNDARIENIKNPKPRVNISYRYGNTNVNHNHTSNGGSNTGGGRGNGKPIGASNKGGLVRVQAPDGTIRKIPADKAGEAVAAGGKLL